jgi:hypothetical protein
VSWAVAASQRSLIWQERAKYKAGTGLMGPGTDLASLRQLASAHTIAVGSTFAHGRTQ